jgi:hypothetical protein
MGKKDSTVRIEIPGSVRSDVVDAIESGEFLDWLYPKTLNETFDEYVDTRQGQFDGCGFTIFRNPKPGSVHYEEPVNTPPQELLDVIDEERPPLFREDYTLRFRCAGESWDNVEEVWVEGYFIVSDPMG